MKKRADTRPKIWKTVNALLREFGYEPMEEVLKLMPKLNPVTQAQIWVKLEEIRRHEIETGLYRPLVDESASGALPAGSKPYSEMTVDELIAALPMKDANANTTQPRGS